VVLLFGSVLSAFAETSSDNYRITGFVLSSAGGSATSVSYKTALSFAQSSPTGICSSRDYSSFAGFWPLTLASTGIGDVNRDGVIDLTDAVLVLQVLMGMDASSVFLSADVNKDGHISMAELAYILQKLSTRR
jgi:hypothetical protein